MNTYRRTLSAGSLIGDTVVTPDGEKLGSLEEIMLDVHTGSIAYAVLSFGGFLGMGEKLFALPWQVLSIDERNKRIVCSIPESRLKSAPGFDKDHWPDFSASAYREELSTYYSDANL